MITTAKDVEDLKSVSLEGIDNTSSGPEDSAELPTLDQVTLTKKSVNCEETCALIAVNNQWRLQVWLEVDGGCSCLEQNDHIQILQQYIHDLEQRRMQKEKLKHDERRMVEEFFSVQNKTLAVFIVHVSVGELQRQIWSWLIIWLKKKRRKSKGK